MMNKFKLFLILMLATFMSVPKVDAIVNMNGSIFTQAPQLEFFDNTRGTLTSVGAGYNSTYGYWLSNNSLITTGANADGVNVTFTANEGFVAGYTYSLSILIGTESSRAKPSSTRICTAENIYNANTRFQQGYPCTNAISITSMDGLANFDFGDVSMPYTILTYVFIPDFTSPTITLTYNTVSGNNSRHLFGGYHLEVLSDNKTGVSSDQVQSIINNSGLASADSVEELQTEINNVKQDINDAGDAIVDSNKETQDVIKDQTKEQIESQKVCKTKYINKESVISNKSYLSPNGSILGTTNNTGVTDYFEINTNTKITLVDKNIDTSTLRYCFYNNDKTYINCTSTLDIETNTEITVPDNAKYIRFTINLDINVPTYKMYHCINGNQALNDNIDDLNENITSTKAPDLGALDNSAGWLPAGPIDSILNLPLSLFSSLLTAVSSTCQPLNLTFPFVDWQFQLPCISSLYSRINGANAVIDFVGLVIGVLILYYYFIHLYNWVDDRLTMSYNDDWGGI